jgi:HD-GYP domain-containing protein (c-di-GMP phosphodiesterase class II)
LGKKDNNMCEELQQLVDEKQKNVEQLIQIGKSLSSNEDFDKVLEGILLGAKNLSNADGGTLYLMNDKETHLSFKVVQTESLNIKMGGTAGEITWPALSLTKDDGTLNKEQVAALCAIEKKLINIPDVYEAEGFNFEGTKKFDAGTGYRTKSMLVVPMTNHENDVIGVLQLLNKQDKDKNTIEFTKEDENIIQSMGSQAAVAISNSRLIKELEALLNAFILSIADAIGEKSKYTGGHINRVAEISEMIANAINEDEEMFKDVHYDKNQIKEISIAAWLHDIGKIVTPEYVVDKATKLETIYDRINTVEAKFEILKRDEEIAYLKKFNTTTNSLEKIKLARDFQQKIKQLEDDFAFVKASNTGGEFMADEKIQRIEEIANKNITLNNQEHKLLSENEVYNLCIKKGTLTEEEREIINNHVVVSYKMLEKLPFPKKLKKVPIMAASHHKKVGGGGYGDPRIMDIPMTLEDKILAVADVFEALTASDRPYKKPNSLNQSMRILSFMVKDKELDRDLVKFFVKKGLHLKYAKENLKESQIDDITIDFNTL